MLFKNRTSFCLCAFAVLAGHSVCAHNIDPKADIHPTACAPSFGAAGRLDATTNQDIIFCGVFRVIRVFRGSSTIK
jgi:hypothetical protein